MNLLKNLLKSKYSYIIFLLVGTNIFLPYQTIAFIPNINIPNKENLEVTGLQIGKTASEFIKYGQIEEGLRLLRLALALNSNEIGLWQSKIFFHIKILKTQV